ncbi:Six-bladed beta-propeller, TolB-like protein [Cordyceps fumosorosea ARSEF 2679]|uniref:Six-bladed beta-propeller, TolB-like protein n=1 Tax=Cordyceps fumosorosea (strain ARSEF 2679) TaxID=1081104 RepID=A0A167ZFW4_CORFA|nr:Six-bladed beta-propeller, TolB-like protein [Cordyceps fumosorosea ARSEF 2679]OAA67467.1 Six-bladed beta-propeller, TolB-like protein [Cordyceps fumosorosea ARSEF 2679]
MVSSSLLLALIPAVAAGPLACKAPADAQPPTACKAPAPKPPAACKPKPAASACTAPKGGFTIKAKSLYPENADFDTSRCVTYISNLYNSTVTVYDAAKNDVTNVLTFDGITNEKAFHISGVQRDDKHDMLTISANAGAAFDTQGGDISGSNMLLQYNLTAGALAWQKDLTLTSNGVYGGFQDMEHDAAGNAFVIGTFPSSILKVSADGNTVDEWFVSNKTGVTPKPHGFTGIAKFDDSRRVLVTDGETGQLLKFDLAAPKGVPVVVPIGDEKIGADLDGAYLPPLHKNTVLLVSDNTLGTVVLRSKDGNWDAAERLGVVPKPAADTEGFAVATVQIADRIYAVTEYFGDAPDPKNATDTRTLLREDYPWYDITDDVQKLLK